MLLLRLNTFENNEDCLIGIISFTKNHLNYEDTVATQLLLHPRSAKLVQATVMQREVCICLAYHVYKGTHTVVAMLSNACAQNPGGDR